jgi:hypothetical protein
MLFLGSSKSMLFSGPSKSMLFRQTHAIGPRNVSIAATTIFARSLRAARTNPWICPQGEQNQ